MDGPAATTIPDLRAVLGAIAAQFQTALHPTLRHGVSFSEFRRPKSAIPLRPTADFTGALLMPRLARFPPFKRCRCRPPPQRYGIHGFDCVARAKPAAIEAKRAHPARMVFGPGGL